MQPIKVTHFTDPGCPWAYSAWPALTALQWRYGAGLAWQHVLIGLTEEREQYLRRGYTPALMSRTRLRFAEYGMPFGHVVKGGVAATSRACRAVVAARQQDPASELPALRALQWLQFTTSELLDDDEALEAALDAHVPGLDAAAAVAAIDSDAVREEYERDRALARTAEGTPAEAQGKTAQTDGPVRYTAPSLVLEADGRTLVAGGWQTLEAYDVLIANLRPDLPRRAAPASPLELLTESPYPLTTAEVAETMRQGNDSRDLEAAREALLGLAAEGIVVAEGLGDDALWAAAQPTGRRTGVRERAGAAA